MSMTRRTFLRHTLAVGPIAITFWIESGQAAQGTPECTLPTGATATRFIPNEPKQLTRYSAAEMADPSRATQLQQFREAIGLVRNRPTNDVIGWTKQIAQHCLNCTPTNQNNIHYNWQFLPWHRGLLYFLERILRNLSNHDDLRLIYWDWERPNSRSLPQIYASANQPLYWNNRNVTGPNWPLSDDDVDVQPLLAVPSFSVFGGTATQRQPVPASFSGPHANVHNNFSPGSMADLRFSPRDPVFYAHHANIDRLWSSWVQAGHSSPNFGNARAYFYDENRQWRYVLLNDLRDEAKLGYKYSSLMQPVTPINNLRSVAFKRTGSRFTISSEGQEIVRKVEGPKYLIIQNIQNLDKLPADTVRYGIFSRRPERGAQSSAVDGYLGKASRVLSSGHAHTSPLTVALNVTGKLGALVSGNDLSFELAVAPLDAEGKTTATAIPLVANNISLIG
jgi:Common central domain of tyrosinase